jgi:aerobic carbon-monoxide dehydrogenase medium subunit
VKPVDFDYVAPSTLPEAIRLLYEAGDEARVLAGGQSLVPMLNFRLVRPRLLVDLRRVPGLAGIRAADGGLVIGAMTRQADAEADPLVRARAPLLAEALGLVAHLAIRARGTIGGSLAHADPAAELPAVAVALDATLTVEGPAGRRTVAADDFFLGYLATALVPGEVVTELAVPARPSTLGSAFLEFSRRPGDFALAGVAALLELAGGRVGPATRVVVLGGADHCHRAMAAETRLLGAEPGSGLFASAAAVADLGIEPPADVHGDAEYRRHLIRTLALRALQTAAARCGSARDG